MKTTFKDWFKENLLDYAADIANNGADCGFPYITYNKDCAELFDQFGDEIIEAMQYEAEAMGHKNWCEMAASFNRADMLETLDTSKTLFVWFMCEQVARELTP